MSEMRQLLLLNLKECKRLEEINKDLLEACKTALSYRKQTHHGQDKCIILLEQTISKAEGRDEG